MKSLSIFVGTAACNAKCAHCAGVPHRGFAHKQDGIVNMDLVFGTMKSCYERGARSLSISSSGEPTLSPLAVSKVMLLASALRDKHDMRYDPINLYSNGIRIGTDENFCETFLPMWKQDGLTTIYVTVHSLDPIENAKVCGVKSYPELGDIVYRIHKAGLKIRANVVLNTESIGTYDKFVLGTAELGRVGVDSCAAWCLRDANDQVDTRYAPPSSELDRMEAWAAYASWKFPIKVYREERRGYQEGDKLTLFPDGTLSNNWCK
jgi:MoaA/NifB/PqqE/SkfB family radical SAM enzyme